ncbi:hypothetical protein BH24ACT5_BH24ACT5_05230 [soil metagenome]
MTIVAVCSVAGAPASTTTALLLAAMAPAGSATLLAECDPSGGDVAAWAGLGASPGWSSAVASGDRSWDAVVDNSQALPSGPRVMPTSARAAHARIAVGEAAVGFAGLLSSMPNVFTVADCGRVGQDAPAWATHAQLALLLVRQNPASASATLAVVDRAGEARDVLRSACRQVGVVLVGGAPYPATEIATALGFPLFGVLPEDPSGAAVVAGGWTLGRRASRTPLARAAGVLAGRACEAVYGRGVPAGASAGGATT